MDQKKFRCLLCMNYYKRDGSNSTGNLIRNLNRKHKNVVIGDKNQEKDPPNLFLKYLKPNGFSQEEYVRRGTRIYFKASGDTWKNFTCLGLLDI
ncbi:unnamed protein product [Allacma fusca]|uniref:BED-type domain-containing protein n=1 Tax=Allacma fusca TaxID=39272 RepID=A0A8J2PXI1_9HEXA|nr:unnamed protein product [Allacma fusca]